jgi:hypothetical protein
MKVKAPFLIETTEWYSPTFGWVFDAGYAVSGVLMLRFNGKLKTCWLWAQGRIGFAGVRPGCGGDYLKWLYCAKGRV